MTTPAVPLTDAELIARTRDGDMASFDELYRRHVDDARRVARIVTGSQDEAEDVVSEAFTRVLDRLQRGGGPDEVLTPYLRTVVRRLAIDRFRSASRDGLPADPAMLEIIPEPDDQMTRATDRELVRQAFETLPERWQRVLWHTEIEGRSPAALAPALGASPNAVAALAYRAREGLRQAYLSVHLSSSIPDECRPYVPKLAAYVRGTLPARDDQWVSDHLEDCEHCRERRDELLLLVSDLRGVLWPALLAPVALGGGGAAAMGAMSGLFGAGSGVAAAATAKASGGVGAWLAKIPRPQTLSQLAASTASVAAATAIVAAAIVVSNDDPPPAPQPAVGAPAAPTVSMSPATLTPTPTPTPSPTPTPTPEPPPPPPPVIVPLDDSVVVADPTPTPTVDAAPEPTPPTADPPPPTTAPPTSAPPSTAPPTTPEPSPTLTPKPPPPTPDPPPRPGGPPAWLCKLIPWLPRC